MGSTHFWAPLDPDGRPSGFYDPDVHPELFEQVGGELRPRGLIDSGCRIGERGGLAGSRQPPGPAPDRERPGACDGAAACARRPGRGRAGAAARGHSPRPARDLDRAPCRRARGALAAGLPPCSASAPAVRRVGQVSWVLDRQRSGQPRHRCSADLMLWRGSPVASTRESSRAAIGSKKAVLGGSRSGGSQSATASTTTLASCRSGVSKPSVNQAWIGARRSCAWRRLPCSAHRRASEVAARSSKPLAC
jgi:hypothetical protein